jgi:hypothetical protein
MFANSWASKTSTKILDSQIFGMATMGINQTHNLPNKEHFQSF